MATATKLYHFFVGGNRFETDKAVLTGTEIKALAGVRAEYQLFFRDDVNSPDREVTHDAHQPTPDSPPSPVVRRLNYFVPSARLCFGGSFIVGLCAREPDWI